MSTSKVISTARVPAGEGLYLRVGYNDHTGLDRLIAERKLRVEGLALDARWHDRQASLRQHADRASLATCLDTQAMELAMPGTASSGYRELPWANPAPHVPEDFSPQNIEQCVDAITERVADGQYSEVMAPAHYVAEPGSAWIDVDVQLTRVLRARLDATDQANVKIIYPLAVHHKVFYDRNGRALLRRVLSRLPIDSVTLRIQPFGNDSGPQALRNFIEACWDFPLEKPLMIERAGFSGLAAFALGARHSRHRSGSMWRRSGPPWITRSQRLSWARAAARHISPAKTPRVARTGIAICSPIIGVTQRSHVSGSTSSSPECRGRCAPSISCNIW